MAVKFSRDFLKNTTKTQGDFHLGHKFQVEINGITVGGIHKVDGLEFGCEVVEYADGDDGITHVRPARMQPGRLVIERDWSGTKEFFNWRKTVMDGRTERQSVSIIFHNDAGEEAKRINLYEAYPTKWSGPSLNSKSSGHASEKLEIVFERIEMK